MPTLDIPRFEPEGTGGLDSPGGYIRRREQNPDLYGQRAFGYYSTLGVFEKAANTDPVIAQCVQGTVLPIARALAQADITPAEGPAALRKGSPNLDPITAFVRRAFFEDMTPSLPKLARRELRTMVVNGHAVDEIVCRYDQPTRRVTLRCLEPRPPWTIWQWNLNKITGRLESITQNVYTSYGWVQGATRNKPIAVDALAIFTLDQEGDDPTGRSMLRPCHKDIEVKLYLKRLLGIWAEREALGVPMATLPKGMAKADKDDVRTFLREIRAHEQSYGTVPAGVEIAWKQGNPDGGNALLAAINGCDLQIRAAFLQGWQSLGTTETGSRAVGEVQADPWVLALEAISDDLISPLNALIRKLVIWNFGPQSAYPYIAIPKLRPEDVSAALKPILEAHQAGLLGNDGEPVARTREMLGFRAMETPAVAPPGTKADGAGGEATPAAEVEQAKPAEQALNGAQITAMVDIVKSVAAGEIPRSTGVEALLAGFPLDREAAERIMGEAGKGASAPPAAPSPAAAMRDSSCPVSLSAWRPWRALEPHERVVAFAEIAARFDAAPRDLQSIVGAALVRSRPDLEKWARKFAKGGAAAMASLGKTDLPKSTRAAIVKAVEDFAADTRAFGYMHAKREKGMSVTTATVRAQASTAEVRAEQLPEAPAGEPPVALADGVDDDFDPGGNAGGDPEGAFESEDDAQLRAIAEIHADRIADEILRSLRLSMAKTAGSKDPPDVLDEVNRTIDDAVESIAEVRRAGASLASEAVAAGRAEVMADAAAEGTDIKVHYSNILDANTCDPCVAAGELPKADSWTAAEEGALPPVPNPECESIKGGLNLCRCLWVAEYPGATE